MSHSHIRPSCKPDQCPRGALPPPPAPSAAPASAGLPPSSTAPFSAACFSQPELPPPLHPHPLCQSAILSGGTRNFLGYDSISHLCLLYVVRDADSSWKATWLELPPPSKHERPELLCRDARSHSCSWEPALVHIQLRVLRQIFAFLGASEYGQAVKSPKFALIHELLAGVSEGLHPLSAVDYQRS